MLQEKTIVDLFCQLAAQNAPSRQERAVADLVCQYLAGLGLAVSEDDAASAIGGNCGNLICRVPASPGQDAATGEKVADAGISRSASLAGQLPPLLFSTHLDTVMPCADKKIMISDDRIIYTDGQTILGADDLAGVTAILAAVAHIQHNHLPHGRLELLFSVAEEQHLLGIQHLAAGALAARQGYVLDTSGAPGLAVIQAPGHIHFDVTITGKSAHAGIAPETGLSAITVAAQAIAAMRLGRVNPLTTANIGLIEGGGETNIVARTCRLTAECRSLNLQELQAQAAHMRACLQQAADTAGARVEVKEKVSYYPYEVAADAPVVRRFLAACQRLQIPANLIQTGGGSDLNILAQADLQGVVLSTGMQNVHSGQEHLAIDDLLNLTRLVIELMTDLGDYA